MVWVRRRGNFAADRGDYGCMACERWRGMLSGQLDGGEDPAGGPLVDEHLAGCAGCREWLDRAATVNRLTRTAVAVPDLGDRILAALPAAHPAGVPVVGRLGWLSRLAGRLGWLSRLVDRSARFPAAAA